MMRNDVDRADAPRDDVERRAYQLYEQRGRADGHGWLAASGFERADVYDKEKAARGAALDPTRHD